MSFNKRSKGSGRSRVHARGPSALTYSDEEDDMRVEVQPDARRLAFIQKHEALATQRQNSTQQGSECGLAAFANRGKTADVKLDAILALKETDRSPAGANPADLHSMLDMVLAPLEDAEHIEQTDVLEVHKDGAGPIIASMHHAHHMVLLPPDQGALQTQVELCGMDEHWAPNSSNCQQSTSQQIPTQQQPPFACLPGTPDDDMQNPDPNSQTYSHIKAANGRHQFAHSLQRTAQQAINNHQCMGYDNKQWDGGGYNGTQHGDGHRFDATQSQPQQYTYTPSQNPANTRAPWLAYTQTAQKQPAYTPAAGKRTKAVASKSTAKRRAISQSTSAAKRGSMSSQTPLLSPTNRAPNTASKDDQLARLLGFDMTPPVKPAHLEILAQPLPANHVVTNNAHKHVQGMDDSRHVASGTRCMLPPATHKDTTANAVDTPSIPAAAASCTSVKANRRSGLAEILDDMLEEHDDPADGIMSYTCQAAMPTASECHIQPGDALSVGYNSDAMPLGKPAAIQNQTTTQHQMCTTVTAQLQHVLPHNSLAPPPVNNGPVTYATPQKSAGANHNLSGSNRQILSNLLTPQTNLITLNGSTPSKDIPASERRSLSDILATNDAVASDTTGNAVAAGRSVWGNTRNRRQGTQANTLSAVLKKALAAVSTRQQTITQPGPPQAMQGSQACIVRHIEHELHMKKLVVDFAEQPGRQACLLVNNVIPGLDRVMEGTRVLLHQPWRCLKLGEHDVVVAFCVSVVEQ